MNDRSSIGSRIGTAGAIGLALSVVLAACADEPIIDREASPILGGDPATVGQFPSVVAILLGNAGLCSGTLVHPEWVLTAAHCVAPAELQVGSQAEVTRAISVLFGTVSAQGGGRTVAAQDSIHAPEFLAPGDPDVGLIHLATPVTDVLPTPINFDPAAAPIGIEVQMVGFGIADSGNAGREFYLEDKVSVSCSTVGVSNGEFLCFDQADGRGKCSGDSGGPSFATIDGVEKVVGITSFGDQDCQYYGADMWTDAAHAFISTNAPELDCQADGACAEACGSGALPVDPDCPVCVVDADCGSSDQACDGGTCVPVPFAPGGLGADCSDGQPACVVGQCGTLGEDSLCTTSCEPAAADSCPSGFDCVGGGSSDYCWPVQADSGGCQAGGGSPVGWMAGLVLAAALGRRRRRTRPRSNGR